MSDQASDPWADIAPGSAHEKVSSRRVDPDHPLEFFWARDHAGRYALLFRSRQPIAAKLPKPSLGGIDIIIDRSGGKDGMLLLVLMEGEQLEIFRTVCTDLLFATRESAPDNDSAAVAIILNRLRRWQDLLKVRGQDLLTANEQMGLLGELMILESVFLKNLPVRAAAAAWRGPAGGEQDFGYGRWLLEVKTQQSTSDQALQISSLAQLDERSGDIVVAHLTFSSCVEAAAGATSLRGAVNGLRSRLAATDIVALDLFNTALLENGYADREEYGQLFFQQQRCRYFRVSEGFPRLVPGGVPAGIRNVKYQIELSACSAFEIDAGTLEGEMFGSHGGH